MQAGRSDARPILVQKFGGTSVGSIPRIHHVASLALAAQRAGYDVVVVVSAMSGETNRLLALADETAEASGAFDRRERDALAAAGEQASSALAAIAIQAAGGKARSFLGHQIRVMTDGNFGDARVKKVETEALRAALARGEIPVIAGFQGVDQDGNITTLGRGGSDTTAVAVAAALGAACDIYTDVDGVYTADPNIVPSARKLAHVTYQHMLTFAALGAKVLHDRCVELAKEFGVAVQVRTSFGDTPGTMITAGEGGSGTTLGGLACDKKLVRLRLAPVSKRADYGTVCARLEALGVFALDQFEDGSFTVKAADVGPVRRALKAGTFPMACLEEVAKVSLVGAGLADDARVNAKATLLLKGFGLATMRTVVTNTSISYFVGVADADETMRVLHDGLGVGVGDEHGEDGRRGAGKRR